MAPAAHLVFRRRSRSSTVKWTAILILLTYSPFQALRHSLLGSLQASVVQSSGHVRSLHRYAVKGLGHDALKTVTLRRGDAFPFDRQWALLKVSDTASRSAFDPLDPQWIHKGHFCCAFTEGERLAQYVTSFDDATQQLKIRMRRSPEKVLIEADLGEDSERERVAQFFESQVYEGQSVKLALVCADESAKPHQFGNTGSGVKASSDTRTIHIINADTVSIVSSTIGVELDPLRFRANCIIEGLKPWTEFTWVGNGLRVGSVDLSVISRTVRCAGIDVDISGTGKADLNLPDLLATHFPEHGPYLGIYCQVTGAGRISIGDGVYPL